VYLDLSIEVLFRKRVLSYQLFGKKSDMGKVFEMF